MRRHLCTTLAYIFILTLTLSGTRITHAATFNVGCDVAELIAAITTVNSNGEADVIDLASGCTYALTAVDNITTGPNGLPAITETFPLTINGNGAIIERDTAAPEFRIMQVSGSVTLRDLTLRNGKMIDGNIGRVNWGGNLTNEGGTVVLIHTIVSEGIANAGGGIFNNGSLTAINSTIRGNSTYAFGGGIFNRNNLTLVNSLVSGNRAGHVGGGINNDAIAAVYNSTISGNFSEIGAGGFHNGLSTSTPTIKNSVIWGNNTQIAAYFTFIVEYNGIQGGFAGTGNLNLSASDSVFVNPRPAAEAPTTAGDYRLSEVSPVIDMGSNAVLPADTYDIDGDGDTDEPLPLDLDDTPRIKHGTVDMGAYEKFNELLTNGDFETAGTPIKKPATWNANLLTNDKRICGGKGYNGTDCAFRFQLNVTDTVNQRQLQQKVNINGLNAGDTLRLSAARRTQGFSGVGFIRVTAFYPDNTKTKKQIKLPKGTAAWKVVSKTLMLSQTPSKIVVLVRVTNAKGTAFVDQVSLTREVVLPLASTSTFTSESLRSIQR